MALVLLAAARLASGAFPEQVAACDLGQLAREAMERITARAELMDAETELEVPAEPIVVRADAVHVSRILDNLLNNALTYVRGRPWIGLRVRVEEGEATVEVEDHGIGIPEHIRERVFERFFRANDPQLPPHPGTGLGLFISRELANRHSGRLQVLRSTPGSGSTLSLSLPVADLKPQVAGSRRSP